MRLKTATEKYNAVLEGNMAKREFVRQMRQTFPNFVSQYDGFDSTVQILKNRQMIFEAQKPAFSGLKVYDDRPALTYSLDALDRGIRVELNAMGIDMGQASVKAEDFKKAEKKAKDNLEKDANHYLNLMAGESNKVDKHDKEKEVKRGAADKDTFNDMKKATLKEEVEEVTYDKDAKLNLLGQVVSALRTKYPDITAGILKDFIRTHGDDLMAGVDIEDEFGEYIANNYEGPSDVREKKGKDHDGDGDIDSDDYMAAKDKAIKKAMGKDVDEAAIPDKNITLADALEKYSLGEILDTATEFYTSNGEDDSAELSKQFSKDFRDMLDDFDGGVDTDESYAMKRMQQAHTQDRLAGKKSTYDLAKEKEKANQEKQLKEAIKSIIKKTLNEDVINEAATNSLSIAMDDFGGYGGAQSVINSLENIVTEVESFYGKIRDKIQKVYDDMNNIENDEGLKIGPFIGPSIENAFMKDLRPVTKKGFTKDLQLPKAKQIDPAMLAQARAAGEVDESPEEPKETVFTPNF